MNASLASASEGVALWPLVTCGVIAALGVVILLARTARGARSFGGALGGALGALMTALLISVLACWLAPKHALSVPSGDIEVVGAPTLVGPEDLALIPGASPLLLVSATDRRASATAANGGLYAVDPTRRHEPPRLVALEGRDSCSFRPHGIDVVEEDGRIWVFVVNHQLESDRDPATGCEPRPVASEAEGSIEVFEYARESGRLRFDERLHDPLLQKPNDVTALNRRRVFVTVPKLGRGELWKSLVESSGSSTDAHCSGALLEWGGEGWRRAAEGLCYPNGVAQDGASIWVTTSMGGGLHRFPIGAAGMLRPTEQAHGVAAPDNLSWASQGRLLAVVHASGRRFMEAADSAKNDGPPVASPFCVVLAEVGPSTTTDVDLRQLNCVADVDADGLRVILRSDGRDFSGASSAQCLGSDLYLGQVFERGIGRVANACPYSAEASLRQGPSDAESE